ncbi:MAG: hypothetical protein OK422_01770 [Thaumarchaeota archaeon]|nr:hypothetical protein [Nitrososphaerota archaeon]
MTEDLVALIKPTQHKSGTWAVTVPRDVVNQTGLEEAFKKGVKLAVYFDKENRRVVYKLPQARDV